MGQIGPFIPAEHIKLKEPIRGVDFVGDDLPRLFSLLSKELKPALYTFILSGEITNPKVTVRIETSIPTQRPVLYVFNEVPFPVSCCQGWTEIGEDLKRFMRFLLGRIPLAFTNKGEGIAIAGDRAKAGILLLFEKKK